VKHDERETARGSRNAVGHRLNARPALKILSLDIDDGTEISPPLR